MKRYEPFIYIFVCFLIAGSLIAIGNASNEIEQKGECSYSSYASYYPLRIVYCELFERRFE